MTTQQVPGKQDPRDDGCKDCKDMENATQLSIDTNRKVLCDLLYDSKGLVAKAETKFDGENGLYKEKRCIFIRTEDTYQRYRNFDITAGTELLQTNETVKTNVSQLKEWNKSLNTALTGLFNKIKDSKGKFADLKDAAYKLDNAYNEQCNAAQRKALTGKTSEDCDDPQKPSEPCSDASCQFDELICMPKGLYEDVVSIYKASSDIIGIQIFSNIDTLDQMQKDLSDKSISFEKHINDTMKLHKADVDKLQEELVSSVKSITKAAMERNGQRANFEGYYDATDFLCCPSCDCVTTDGGENQQRGNQNNCDDGCEPRLKDCEKEICRICDEVKETFCCNTDDTSTGTTVEANYSKKS
jgi:hypothetical protein